MKKTKSSFLAALRKRFRRKPKPELKNQPVIFNSKETITMADKKSLHAIIDLLMAAFISEKMKNDALESANRSLFGRITDLENVLAAEAAADAAKEAEIAALLNAPGGSTGNM